METAIVKVINIDDMMTWAIIGDTAEDSKVGKDSKVVYFDKKKRWCVKLPAKITTSLVLRLPTYTVEGVKWVHVAFGDGLEWLGFTMDDPVIRKMPSCAYDGDFAFIEVTYRTFLPTTSGYRLEIKQFNKSISSDGVSVELIFALSKPQRRRWGRRVVEQRLDFSYTTTQAVDIESLFKKPQETRDL